MDEAIAAYRRALELPEDKSVTPTTAHTLAHNSLGYALQQQGKLEDAITEYEKALAIDPTYSTAQTNLTEAKQLLALRRQPAPSQITETLISQAQESDIATTRAVVRVLVDFST